MQESNRKTFNHLKIHTQYSICEGAVKIEDLKNYCKDNKIKSIGLCDTSNLCGALEFAEKISKSGTQPIIGTQIKFKIGETTGLLPLFALNENGYKNIIDISSSSYLENNKLSDPHVKFNKLLSNSDGVAVFSGTSFGLFGQLFDKGKFTEIHDLYSEIKKIYGDRFYIDIPDGLSDKEKEEWERVQQRVEGLCEKAHKLKVRLYADAEESWMQEAADLLMEKMMARFNKEEALIFNTFQCYRWDRLEYIKELHAKAKEQGFKIGAKIVRGAYMEKENKRARKRGKKSPICKSKEATDVNFNSVMGYCLDHLEDFSVFIGTHNEISNYLALQILEDKGIAKDDQRVWFSQLYGMSDQISYNLAARGYNTAKLVPFGPVKDVVPYLLRRAEENSSVKGQTSRELNLLSREKERRKKSENLAEANA